MKDFITILKTVFVVIVCATVVLGYTLVIQPTLWALGIESD